MCEGHTRCTRYPVYRVAVHRVDECNRPNGPNSVYDLCPACTRATAYRIEESLNEMRYSLECKVCRRDIAALHDVLTVEYARESA